MRKSESIAELAKALAKAQAKMPVVRKEHTATVPLKSGGQFSYKYADLADTIQAALPVLAENGISLVQSPAGGLNDQWLTILLIHESGEWLEDDMPLYMPKADAQGQGSAITYARRYQLSAFIGVAPDADDDGGAATAAAPKRQRRQPTEPEYITANEANEITEILNLIVDESKRNLAKQDFVSVFGKPTEVVTGMADRARDYAQGKLEESVG